MSAKEEVYVRIGPKKCVYGKQWLSPAYPEAGGFYDVELTDPADEEHGVNWQLCVRGMNVGLVSHYQTAVEPRFTWNTVYSEAYEIRGDLSAASPQELMDAIANQWYLD